jgi:hypothetical protein
MKIIDNGKEITFAQFLRIIGLILSGSKVLLTSRFFRYFSIFDELKLWKGLIRNFLSVLVGSSGTGAL